MFVLFNIIGNGAFFLCFKAFSKVVCIKNSRSARRYYTKVIEGYMYVKMQISQCKRCLPRLILALGIIDSAKKQKKNLSILVSAF